ncbi:MAG: GNAT family N-acetyltransferase [Candidatus Latescibacterota bacterium]|nr:MAG: GNAT family N-acetyltransferase [Candidatus Latescibacterota bacterium]
MPARKTPIEVHPLTPDRWADFAELFGPRGAYAGCWCMWWRLARSEFTKNQGEGNRRAMKKLVDSGRTPGLLAYADGKAVGWCAVAPREEFASLERSRVLKRLDDEPVWSIVCFFIAKGWRGRGVGEALARGAIRHAKSRGGKILEAYPTHPRGKELPPVSSFMGLPSLFEKVGFTQVARPSEAKVILRKTLR